MPKNPLKLDRKTLLLLAGQWLLFVGNFVFYWRNPLPAWAHVLLGVVAVHLAFTIWHEAAHRTVSNRRWINDTVGILGMFPYTTPFFMQRHIHLDHHKYLNEPGRDPNQIYADGPFWQLPLRYVRTIGYARSMLRHDPRSAGKRFSDNFFVYVVVAMYAIALWRGFFLDLLLIWFLPVVIAKVILDWYVNYLPHVGLPPHRFLGTRILDVPWLRPFLLEHNYHALHHLWPSIPWHRYADTYRERIEYLRENRVPIERHLFGRRRWTQPTSDALAATRRDDVG